MINNKRCLKRICNFIETDILAIPTILWFSIQHKKPFIFHLGFMSHQFQDMTANYSVVRSVLFSPAWALRLNHLHQYLCTNLNAYAIECTAVYPPSDLVQVSYIYLKLINHTYWYVLFFVFSVGLSMLLLEIVLHYISTYRIDRNEMIVSVLKQD